MHEFSSYTQDDRYCHILPKFSHLVLLPERHDQLGIGGVTS